MASSANNPTEFSDEAVRRFLFGRLSPAEQSNFEAHLFTDDRLEARVRLAEFELADDYALARLGAADRKAFEEKFLLTADRKRTLNVSTALRDRFAPTSTAATPVTKSSIGERLRFLVGLNQRRWRFAFGVAVFVVLVAAAWLAMREARNKREVYQPPIVRSSPSPSSKREAGHPSGAASPAEHQITPSPMPPHEPTASPAIVSVALLPGAAPDDDKLPRINLPKGEHDIVRLQLALKANRTRTYRAEILTTDGQSVFSAQSLQPADNGASNVDFDVPAAILKPSDYQVKLGRADGGLKESFASYYFRVQ